MNRFAHELPVSVRMRSPRSPRCRLAWRLAAGAILVVGCGDTPAEPVGDADLPAETDYPLGVRAEETAVSARTMPVTLVNQGFEDIGYNLCIDGHVERYTNRGWVAVAHDPTPCPLLLHVLSAGDSVAAGMLMPTGVPTGTYRARVELQSFPGGTPVMRRSNAVWFQR